MGPPMLTKAKSSGALMSAEDEDTLVLAGSAAPRHPISFAAAVAGCGLISYLLSIWVVATGDVGSKEVTKAYHDQVDPQAYQWPMAAFFTAFCLNIVTLTFERESAKFQLALLACYINGLAFFNDYISYKQWVPMGVDVWGQTLHIARFVMWVHTTPAMVYLLSIISDFPRNKVVTYMGIDVAMIVLGLFSQLTDNKIASVFGYIAVFGLFGFLMHGLWKMFDAPMSEAPHDGALNTLKATRLFTVGFWFLFPAIWAVSMADIITLNQKEWLWTLGDFLGKVMFSTSLLESNFLSIESRRFLAMKMIEEANKVQVIQELKDLIEQKERFLSGMSHELRTPLNGIIGLSEALIMGSCGTINEAATKTITTIKTSGARLLNLINDILDAASMRQAKGKLTIKHEKITLSRIAEDVVDLCQPLAKRGVRLVNALPRDIPAILGDTGRLIQIFHNLIGNSCKFTHTGTITISAVHKMDEVEVSVTDTGIGIPSDKFQTIFQAFEQVDMSTTRKYGGTGLGLNLVKQLVEAHNGTIDVRSKLGVGTTFFFTLKVWDDAMEELQETAEATPGAAAAVPAERVPSRPSKDTGRTFAGNKPASASSASGGGNRPGLPTPPGSVKFTPGQEAAAPAGPEQPPPSPKVRQSTSGKGYDAANVTGPVPLNDAMLLTSTLWKRPNSLGGAKDRSCPGNKKIHVLSVDDDPVNQMVMQNLLDGNKYEITQAMTGQEALDLLSEMDELPDVILLDVMMPGMSGYETCQQIREKFPLSCMPIIMVSAKGKEENIVEGLQSGSNDYVVKPFGRQEILARIDAHLRFRDETFQAGEMSSTDENGLHVPVNLSNLVNTEAYGTSLPQGLAAALKSGQGNSVQVYKQVTLLTVQVTNHRQLCKYCTIDDVTAVLTKLHAQLDQALKQYNGYCVDNPTEGYITILTGLKGEEDQVERAVKIAQALLDHVDDIENARLPDNTTLNASAAIHSLPSQGVVVGITHPCLFLTGQLPTDSINLLTIAPPGNVLISAEARALLTNMNPKDLVEAVEWNGGMACLLKRDDVEAHIRQVTAQAAKMASLPNQIATNKSRLLPLQRALMELVRISPLHMFELGNAALTAALKNGAQDGGKDILQALEDLKNNPTLLQQAYQSTADRSPEGPAAAPVGNPDIEKLTHTNAVLTRQLDETAEEVERLTTEVESLQEQLKFAKAGGKEALSSASEAAYEIRIVDLERQVCVALEKVENLEKELAISRAEVAIAEKRTAALQDAMVRAYEGSGVPLGGTGLQARGNNPLSNPASPRIGSNPNKTSSVVSDVIRIPGPGDYTVKSAQDETRSGIARNKSLSSMIRAPESSPGPQLALPPEAYSDITVLLEELGLQELVNKFVEEEITPDVLPHMNEDTLRNLGVTSLGARLKLRMACEAIMHGLE